MATDTKTAEKTAANTAAKIVLPEGFSENDFHVVGGFTPMYKPKNAFEGKWAPVLGFGMFVDALSEIVDPKGKEPPRIALVATMLLVAPNQGQLGDRTDEKNVPLEAGKKILVPIGGNLLWNKDFTAAMFDKKNYYLMRLSVIGQVPSDYPADMWEWKVEINSKRMLRADHPILKDCDTTLPIEVTEKLTEKQRKPLPPTAYAARIPILGTGNTSTGEIYDTRTGQLIQKSLVAPNGSA